MTFGDFLKHLKKRIKVLILGNSCTPFFFVSENTVTTFAQQFYFFIEPLVYHKQEDIQKLSE